MKYVPFLALLCVSLASCDNEAPQTQESFQNPYAYVGEEHNKALDDAMAALLAQKPQSVDEVQPRIESLIVSHMKETGIAGGATDAELHHFASLGFGGTASFGETAGRTAFPAASALNPAQQAYIARIDSIVSNSSSPADVPAALSVLNQEVSNSLSAEDAAAILITSAVTASSAKYWDGKMADWMTRYGVPPAIIDSLIYYQGASQGLSRGVSMNMLRAEPGWMQVVRSDGEGALLGAIGSAVTGCAQMSLGACLGLAAIAGGATSSTLSMIMFIVENY